MSIRLYRRVEHNCVRFAPKILMQCRQISIRLRWYIRLSYRILWTFCAFITIVRVQTDDQILPTSRRVPLNAVCRSQRPLRLCELSELTDAGEERHSSAYHNITLFIKNRTVKSSRLFSNIYMLNAQQRYNRCTMYIPIR